jgi:hypothetical protein
MKTISLRLVQPATLASLAIAIICGVCAGPAQAGYLVTLQQVGPDVVATGSGAVDLTGLSLDFTCPACESVINPSVGGLRTGSTGPIDAFSGAISGPTSFGSGSFTFANSGSGDLVGAGPGPSGLVVEVPQSYVSNNLLSDSAIYNSATFSSLGVTPGTYAWTWGTGVNQNFTLQIPTASVPDSGSTFGLLLLAVATLFGISRIRSLRVA